MFDSLSERLSGVFDGLIRRGVLTEKDVDTALREIRVVLLEADVALPAVNDFIRKVREKAVGEDVIRSVSPGQQVVKAVHDGLVDLLGGEGEPETLALTGEPPVAILMAGLQGSGKTTTTAKVARRITEHENKKVLVASLDTRRPAAMEQLAQMAQKAGVQALPIVAGQSAVEIARRAMRAARLQGYDVVILDTAGRTSIDEAMMAEAAKIAEAANPRETLLVADSLTGQDAVETARRFNERLRLTGLILTRMDGDGRGGAALSMRWVTGLPIKFLGVSERVDGLDAFDARRLAGRILGRGDIISLVEKAIAEADAEKAEKLARKMAKGRFDLEDLADQLRQLRKMGGFSSVMGLLPGMNKAARAQIDNAGFDDSTLKRQEAIILSMTRKERTRPDILKASRKRRIAKGAGVEVPEVNRLLKMHRQMAGMMKKMGRKGGKGGFPGLPGAMPSGFDSTAADFLGGHSPGNMNLPGLGGPLGSGGPPFGPSRGKR